MKICQAMVVVAAALILCGCGKEKKSPPLAAPSSPPTAANGYMGTLLKGQEKAIKTIDVTSLNENLNLFNVQEGRYPNDLNELVTKKYLPYIPDPPAGMKLVYDAAQGKVSVAPQ